MVFVPEHGWASVCVSEVHVSTIIAEKNLHAAESWGKKEILQECKVVMVAGGRWGGGGDERSQAMSSKSVAETVQERHELTAVHVFSFLLPSLFLCPPGSCHLPYPKAHLLEKFPRGLKHFLDTLDKSPPGTSAWFGNHRQHKSVIGYTILRFCHCWG